MEDEFRLVVAKSVCDKLRISYQYKPLNDLTAHEVEIILGFAEEAKKEIEQKKVDEKEKEKSIERVFPDEPGWFPGDCYD